MFLRQLSSSAASFLPHSRPALSRAGFRSSSASSSSFHIPRFLPAPHPWWSVQGFPPWPPRLPHSHPAGRRVFSGRTSHPRSIGPGDFGGSWRSFSTSPGLMMERHDREPPHKRRKSTEEKKSFEEREGRRGGGGAAGTTGGEAKDGGSKREHHHLGSSTDSRPRPNHCFKDGSRDRGRNGAGKDVSRENSRDKDVERTKAVNKDRQRKDSAGRDETTNRGRSAHQHGGHKDSQHARSRTQTPKSKPEAGQVPTHKPNPWFKQRGAEERGGKTKGPEGPRRDRSSDGGQWPELPSQPCSTTPPPNPWKVAGADRQPPPPGTGLPVRQQEVKCKFALFRLYCM